MGLESLPAIARATAPAVATFPARLPTIAQTAKASGPAARFVGSSAAGASTVTRANLAKSLKALPPSSKMMNKRVVIGGSAIAVSTLAGYEINDLIDTLSAASPDELQQLVATADMNGESAVAEHTSEVYNMSLVDRAALQPSNDDKGLQIVDNIDRPGLGISRDQINAQQAVLRAYKSIRGVLSYDDIWTLRVLITTASDEDLIALEDLHRG